MGIDVLERLTKQIVTKVQTLVSAPPTQTGKYAHLLESLNVAFGQGLAIVGGLVNATAPVNRIPPELLTSIFALSSESVSHGSRLPYWPFEEPDLDDLHKLPKVCRYWRELALATPTLWNTVVTVPHSRRSDDCFRRSIYLPADLSVNLTVHFNSRRPSKHSTEKMTKFMLTNSSKICELHAWDTYSIEDLPLFLRSFDASALEHCTISQNGGIEVPIGTGPLPFFNGGARLRSLCLIDLRGLPENEFPALTLLKIGFVGSRIATVCWDVKDLVKFLARSPKLEEVYIHDMPYSERRGLHKSPVAPAPVSLPRLQYLAFTYSLHTVSDDPTHLTDFLLSLISIPPTCHMYLPAPFGHNHGPTKGVGNILDSVCRRVPGKDAVSHMFLGLSDISTGSPMQLVFRQGSLRLQIPTDRDPSSTFPYHVLFRAFPHLFSATEELRIHYTKDRVATAALGSLLPAGAFPNITALSVIRDIDKWCRPESRPTLRAGLAHLAQPTASSPGADSESESVERCPYPALDTLWTSLESSDEIAELDATLAARASLGFPVRRLIVSVHYSYSLPADSDDLARLRALGAEEVIVMDAGASSALGEVDWMGRLPERFSLPSAIHRDWPTVWGRQTHGGAGLLVRGQDIPFLS
ncbi:hypothetical protein LXA43DRAFT_1096523 [Ganoderma leucocontextum]|nr:hypothetical protein LXA43DRAFT_1096523 [Ganoderma leucocontextum]